MLAIEYPTTFKTTIIERNPIELSETKISIAKFIKNNQKRTILSLSKSMDALSLFSTDSNVKNFKRSETFHQYTCEDVEMKTIDPIEKKSTKKRQINNEETGVPNKKSKNNDIDEDDDDKILIDHLIFFENSLNK